MENKTASISKMLILSIAFTMLLLAIRIALTHTLTYIFFAWNTFLAIIPLVFSNMLANQSKLGFKSICILLMWLIFYPNAPYIITDLFHYVQRPPVPYWFDLLICISAVWNGVVLGLVSLVQVEQFLMLHLKQMIAKTLIFFSFMLCSYGIYIGRFLRFNSWDIITDIDGLINASLDRIIHPFQHITTWSFTVLFAAMMAMFYYTIKAIHKLFF